MSIEEYMNRGCCEETMNKKPKVPLVRIIYEGDGEPRDLCHFCGSSRYIKWRWLGTFLEFVFYKSRFRDTGCINEDCSNYYKN